MYPALAVAAELAEGHDDVVYVGTPDGLEARLVPEAGVEFRQLSASGFDRARPWTAVTAALSVAASALKAWGWFGADRPDVVIGFGGYVSVPVAVAAILRRVPLVLHEQNSVPGLANRVLSRWATAVAITYPESASHLVYPDRSIVTGNPVREAVLAADAVRGRRVLGVPAGATVLLVFGGSRGARHLNQATVGLAKQLLGIPGLHVVLVAGRAEAPSVRELLDAHTGIDVDRFHVLDYVDDMGSAIAAADLVVARAGATSIAELTVLGAPCVLVPYPYATDDHQTGNATAMVEHGAAVLIADAELDDERFGNELVALLSDPERRDTMSAASRALGRPDASSRVVAVANRAAGGPHKQQPRQVNT